MSESFTQSTFESSPLVHGVGGGKAAFGLHGPNWLAVGCDLNITDVNPAALTVDKEGVPDSMREAHRAGRVSFRRLGELAVSPNIIDITTASGHHLEAVHQTLEELEARGALGSQLPWLIEKPVTSSDEEIRQLGELLASGRLDKDKVFVNGHYLVSKALDRAKELLKHEAERGVTVTMVDVVFNKNRKPDVDAGRFTDPVLGAYGIEMPHQLVVAYSLAGVSPGDARPIILGNKHYDAVDDVPNSQGSYTAILTANNVMIRMAQGLGPYTMYADGNIVPRDDQPVERYAVAKLSDGRIVQIEFAPVAGLERSQYRVTWQDTEDQQQSEVITDKILRTVMGGIATFAVTGEKPAFATAFNVPNALAYARTLNEFARDAHE